MFNISFNSLAEFIDNSGLFTKIADKFKSMFSRKDPISDDMVVEVETSQGLPQENESDTLVLGSDEPDVAPVFEIIPSQAEPDVDINIGSVDTLVPSSMKVSQGIPSDKIWEYPPDTLLAEPPARVIDTSDIDKK